MLTSLCTLHGSLATKNTTQSVLRETIEKEMLLAYSVLERKSDAKVIRTKIEHEPKYKVNIMMINTQTISIFLLGLLSLVQADQHHAATFGFAASVPHVVPWGNTEQFEFQDDDTQRYTLLHREADYYLDMLDIQIQTRAKDFYAYIEAAVLRVGDVTIEVRGGSVHGSDEGLQGRFWVNGEELLAHDQPGNLLSLGQLEGFESATFHHINSRQFALTADLGNGDMVKFEAFDDYIRVDISTTYNEGNNNDEASAFAQTFGLMGSFPEGVRIARDQSTILKSSRTFTKEWRVLDTDEDLFLSQQRRSNAMKALS